MFLHYVVRYPNYKFYKLLVVSNLVLFRSLCVARKQRALLGNANITQRAFAGWLLLMHGLSFWHAAALERIAMSAKAPRQFVAVLDFGAQYGQLIARRVRDLHVYSEIVPCDIAAADLVGMKPAAIILSGGPASVYAPDAPDVDPAIFDLGIPMLGFCYDPQIMARASTAPPHSSATAPPCCLPTRLPSRPFG